MKRILRFIGLIAAMAVIVTAFPISVNALKLQDYDYKFPNGAFTRDVENGSEPDAAAQSLPQPDILTQPLNTAEIIL